MAETKPYNLQSPEQIAKDYNGNKQKIAEAMQLGVLDPTAGTLAGMFIDRMRAAAQMEAAPQQTVAQQVFAPPTQPAMPAGLGATPEAAAMMPTAPTNPTVPMPPPGGQEMTPPVPMPSMAGGGLADLYVPDDMFDEPTNGGYDDGYAGGGIVAFAQGDLAALGPTDEYGRPITFQGAQSFYDSLGLTYNDIYEKEAEKEALKARSPEEMKKLNKQDMWSALGMLGARIATTPGGLLQGISAGIKETLPEIQSQKAARKLEQKQALDALVGIEGQRYNRKGDRVKSALEFQGQAITADQAKKARDQAGTLAREGYASAERVARINKDATVGAAEKMYAASIEAAKKQAFETTTKMLEASEPYQTAVTSGDYKTASQIFNQVYTKLLGDSIAINTGTGGTGQNYPLPNITPEDSEAMRTYILNQQPK